ncbi:intermembrane lipid transfer protein VPS13D-like [Physella acuta]|uniref:intermembrane lipid transfer protein VPS13D-like n=1 Tax=Physella acuta TaxID=109671 RepID=UPI0027DC7D7F|nr:intermembrane lipid transfer protein VPS13D-like [Physella acuta]
MLEGLAAWVLNTYVGEYVENLNTAQLSIALLQGAVELENLPLKKDALKSLDIPIEVKSGFIGKITLHIPLRRLRSEPWVISIEKLYLVAGPLSTLQYNEELERKHAQEQKKTMLDALEEKWQIFQGTQPDQSSASWFSYGTSMAANILENIQLKVKDVHLRYEDDKTNPSCPFACGVIIKNLSVQSTDASWMSKFVSHYEADKMFKLVDLKDFGIYCDTNVSMLGNLPMSELSDVLEREMFLSASGQFMEHEYILRPVTAQGKVTRNTSALPLHSLAMPRIFVELTLGDMSFSLTPSQYQSLYLWQKEFVRHNRRRKYRKCRPAFSVNVSPREWWHFAQEAHLAAIQERNERLTKNFMVDRVHAVTVYSKIYTTYLKGEPLTLQQKATKTNIEEEFTFEELKGIREAAFFKVKKSNLGASITAKKTIQPPEAVSPTQATENGSLFQRWFPGWSGWSQPATAPASDVDSTSPPTQSEPNISQDPVLVTEDILTEDEIEQEIQDVIKDSSEHSSFLRKDSVFARMTFLLKKGSFHLKSSQLSEKTDNSLVELHCSTIAMEFESRPRTSAMRFSLAVGNLFVQDHTSKSPMFTYVICPQAKDPNCKTAFNPISQIVNAQNIASKDYEGMEFFKLSYEKTPGSKFKYSLNIKTQPLDIIYTPELIHRIKDLFSTPTTGLSRAASSVSSWQFDKLRKQTQEELRNTLDQLLEGKTSRWNINLDISAPKLIIPESVTDSNPQLVVIDLGNFRLNTVSSPSDLITDDTKVWGKYDDLEDKFETPLSTPPNETEEDAEVKKTMSAGHMAALKQVRSSDSLPEMSTDNMFQDRLYERYRIGLTEVQVLLGRLHDNWKHAYARGTSLMHVVDRFNISVMLERRLIVTSDAQWPAAKLSGNLPTLTFHLNERKIQGLEKCLEKFTKPKTPDMSHTLLHQHSSFDSNLISGTVDQSSFDDQVFPSPKENTEENKMVVLQFLINNLSLEVQSQGQALIELQVTGVQADVHLKPLNMSLVLTVHSLLLVDALQTYGRDFELLIASHRNVMLDSRSGSIKGSEVNSPSSPMSPSSPASPGSPNLNTSISFSSFQSIQDAISNAFHSVLPQAPAAPSRKSTDNSMPHHFTASDAKALIMLEYEVITSPASMAQDGSAGDTVMRVLNLQFNSLDFIANQETLTEIMSFVNRTFPQKPPSEPKFKPTVSPNVTTVVSNKKKDIVLVNADFKRLNVMLVKFLTNDGHKLARKVATATMSSAKLEAKFDDNWEMEGSLGGLHLIDVTPEGTIYQQVVSIGHFQEMDCATGLPTTPPSFTLSTSPNQDMFKTARDERIFSDSISSHDKNVACKFVIKNRQQKESDGSMLEDNEHLEAKFDMAALTYIHCPKFLEELVDCVSEFRDYMTKVASSIKTAATEVAMGIVGVRGENTTLDASLAGYAIRRDQSIGDITSTILLEDVSLQQGNTSVEANKWSILINARMASPILVFPRTPNSPQVLLARLGEIVIDNSMQNNTYGRSSLKQDLMNLTLTNMNLYSLNSPATLTPDGLSIPHWPGLINKFGVPILYDTSIELSIGKRENPFINISSRIDGFRGSGPQDSPVGCANMPGGLHDGLNGCANMPGGIHDDLHHMPSILDMKAKISSPLKLSLSKEVYEQILQTVDHLTYDAPNPAPAHSPNIPVYTSHSTSSPQEKVKDEPDQVENFLAKHIKFDVPLFEVELRGDFGDGERGLVDLKLYDFAVQYEKNEKACTHISLHLKSLQMDDLLEPEHSKHRQIIVSHPSKINKINKAFDQQPKAFMSKSCPDSTIMAPIPRMPPSLPSSFIDRGENPMQHFEQHKSGSTYQRRRAADSEGDYPYTPPPSPVARDISVSQQKRTDDLVHIDVTLVDKKRPEYITKYNKMNRFVNVDFACLDATINLQTWVVLLDFLGLGAKVHDVNVTSDTPTQAERKVEKNVEGTQSFLSLFLKHISDVNSDINFQVESFTLIFNKPDYELAHATVADLKSHIVTRDGNLSASGQLGSLSLLDESPHGQLYRQRFVSTGRQVVEFNFFKFGMPDPGLQREFDISLKLRMSSVRYLHTNRFQAEMVAFVQHFLQLQDLLGRQRAASVGKQITDKATRGSRISLDIEALSPILLIPHSSRTKSLLVVDLGHLKLRNIFLLDGQTGTLRAARKETIVKQHSNTETAQQKDIFLRTMTESQLNASYPPTQPHDPMSQSVYGSLDGDYRLEGLNTTGLGTVLPGGGTHPKMQRHLSESYLMSSQHAKFESAKRQASVNESTDTKEEEEEDYRCMLDVISVTLTDMDLFTAKRISKSEYQRGDLSTDMEFSNFVVEREHGRLLNEKCLLELHIERNLEGDVSHTAPDFCIKGNLSSVDCHLDVSQYELIRGILHHNLGERLEEFQRPLMTHLQDPKIQTVLSGRPWKGISLIFDLRNVTVELLHSHPMDPNTPEKSLARLDFICSQLSYSGYSNQLKEVDLVSNEIRVYDTRFKNEPVNSRPNVFTSILQPSSGSKDVTGLQMEMHLRAAPDSTHFTIILNNVRLMCVFDWLLAMKEFLSREPPDPFAKAGHQAQSPYVSEASNSPIPLKSGKNQSPLTVSRGIITRRGPFIEEVKVPFELVLNFSDTQFVVVEDSTSLDTNAVILKNTAVIIYKPQAKDKVLSCSLQGVELFSCCLMAEEETALSIIDPIAISIELNANPLPQPNPNSSGLLGLKDAQRRHMVLELALHNTLNIRVSYHDLVMFLAIMNSLPQQALQAKQQATALSTSTESTDRQKLSTSREGDLSPMFGDGKSVSPEELAQHGKEEKEEEVAQLLELGFAEGDVRKALAATSWDLEEAALWLTDNIKHQNTKAAVQTSPVFSSDQDLITAIELNDASITLCLIDDCGDADIPLVEISCNALKIQQELDPTIEGRATFQLIAEYYNRKLSGWEPCLEPWRCCIDWKQYSKPEKKLAVGIAASDVLNLNITSTLIDLYKQTSGTWAADYLSQYKDKSRISRSSSNSSEFHHKRLPFIPYTIRNDTGSSLWFHTATTTPTNLVTENQKDQKLDSAYLTVSEWKRVGPGESKPFHFQRQGKLRHQKSHAMHVNQLLVTVEGWQKLSPVSVDKIGIYFRHAEPELKAPPDVIPARVVFEVQQEGSARKLIIVRSALVIHNRLDSPVDLRLEATDESGQCKSLTIPVNSTLPIPLSCINMRIRARPADWPVHFCKKPLDWQHVKKCGEHPDGIRTCDVIGPGEDGVYRFFVCVTRQKYPLEVTLGGTGQHGHGVIHPTLPGHVLTLLPPVTLLNLLPLELHYYLKGTGVSGNLKAGKQAALHGLDVLQNFHLGIHLENFPDCKELTFSPNMSHKKLLLRIYDNNKRMLKLVVRVNIVKGGSVLLIISAQFWLVNKSGIPLVFRQDGSKVTAAGQFEEHEQARSVTPLLFSFSDNDEVHLCQMRVGTSVHGAGTRPQWSVKFSLEGGTSKRALHVVQMEGNRPDRVYNIGIQVSAGRGRYRGTNIVTFAPHFVLDNQSSFKLAITQQFMTKKEVNQPEYLTAFPQSSLPYHWPRVDLNQLLCVKVLDVEHCKWSGGFHIDKIHSFHINMRDMNGTCHLLKVEVVQQGPTFFTVFADADVMPPPFRIDNLSEVPVLYHQTGVSDDRLKSFIKPHTQIPYAWDEPTVQPLRLTLSIMGGTSASYALDKSEEGEQLHYENFIYLAASSTFDKTTERGTELVLECGHNHNIVFKRKENSKRGQLWRMTGSGMLEHEGSMPPRDPKNPNSNAEPGLVLDIADLAPRPDQCVPLVLKKPDVRRKSTQTWRFTKDGLLCCQAGSMCVQAVGGVKGLQEGAIVVLGPGPDVKESNSVLSHMLISKKKLRPGSGCVSVRVKMDGPIRVIELVDIFQRSWMKDYTEASRLSILLVHKALVTQQRPSCLHRICSSAGEQIVKRLSVDKDLDDWQVYDELKDGPERKPSSSLAGHTIELSLTLKDGIGVSLVNSFSEELLYLSLKNICLEIISRPSAITFEASVALIQADNQMWGTQRPVVMFVTPLSRRDMTDSTPALLVSAHKVPSGKWKAEIFKHLYVCTKRMTIHIEEKLLWKLMQFAGVGKDDRILNRLDEATDTHRALSAVTAIQSTRYYFGAVRLSISRVTLSMLTTSKLTPDLKAIKNAVSTRLIAFEQANIDLRHFEQYHMFETGPFLISEIMNHYREELIGQAAKILGSVDFLGNPLGLVHDITEGIAGFVKDGNVGGLLKNVTHGVSNSTAKVVSSLSDGISTVGFDEEHNQRREALKNVTSGSSSDHLMAGFKGLGHGLLGGVTSFFSQSISGAQSEGAVGLIKGMGKGVLGTVTKPVSGVLDLTSGFANALRDSSTRTSHRDPARIRGPRRTQGPGGLLPLYSKSQAEALTILYELNGNDFSEYLIAMEQLTTDQSGEGNMQVIISSRQLFFFNQRKARSDSVVLNITYPEILLCSSQTSEGKHYIELTRKSTDVSNTTLNKPLVRCDKLPTAKKVAQEIKYAKNLFDERAQTLEEDESSDDGDAE